MSETEENVFEDVEMIEDMPEEEVSMDEDVTEDVFNVQIPSESPKEKLERTGVKAEMDGKTLTIKEIGHTKIRTKAQDGTKIEPKATQNGDKFYYPGKLKIAFEEDNIVEYYPNFHYFVDENGKVNMVAKINRNGQSAVTKIFNLAVAEIDKPSDEISDQEFYDFLIGKKVKIKTEKGTYNKKAWFRNDIIAFVK